MKSDLEKMVRPVENYFRDNKTYAGYVAPSGSPGVTLKPAVSTSTGWSATATHANAPGAMCDIGVGTQTPFGRKEGEAGGPLCR